MITSASIHSNCLWAGSCKNPYCVVHNYRREKNDENIDYWMPATFIPINRRVYHSRPFCSALQLCSNPVCLYYLYPIHTALASDVIPYSLLWQFLLLTAAMICWLHNISSCLRCKKNTGDCYYLFMLKRPYYAWFHFWGPAEIGLDDLQFQNRISICYN